MMEHFYIYVLIAKCILVAAVIGIFGFELGLTIREMIKDCGDARSQEEEEPGSREDSG